MEDRGEYLVPVAEYVRYGRMNTGKETPIEVTSSTRNMDNAFKYFWLEDDAEVQAVTWLKEGKGINVELKFDMLGRKLLKFPATGFNEAFSKCSK